MGKTGLVIMYQDCRDVVSSTLERVRADWYGMRSPNGWDPLRKVAHAGSGAIESMERHRESLQPFGTSTSWRDLLGELERLAEWLRIDSWLFLFKLIRDSSSGSTRRRCAPKNWTTVIDVAGPTMRRLSDRAERVSARVGSGLIPVNAWPT